MKISILIVCYNHEQYIARAIESVLNQQFTGTYEIILCDDHSQDNTLDIASQLLSGHLSHSICSNTSNIGITRNYQKAFKRCMGEYIFVLEGDDYWLNENKVAQQIQFMDQHPTVSICSHEFYKQYDNNPVLEPPAQPVQAPYQIFTSAQLIENSGLISNFSTCCYRRSMLDKIPQGVFEVISYEWMVNISIGITGPLAKLSNPLSVYRITSAGQWSKKTRLEQLQGMYSIIPAYDIVLNKIFHKEFIQKQRLLEKEIKWVTRSNSNYCSPRKLISQAIDKVKRLCRRFIPKIISRTNILYLFALINPFLK